MGSFIFFFYFYFLPLLVLTYSLRSAPKFSEPFVFEAARETVVMKDKPPDKEDNVQTKKKISFRNILIEGKKKTQIKEIFDLIEKGSIKTSNEGGNRLLPKVTLDDTYFHELCHPWNDALVIKLLGKNGRYYVLKERLKKLWK